MQRSAYGGTQINRTESPWRARSVHYVSIMIGSLLPFFILADVMPIAPPLGYIIFLAWRLMRPGLMPLWIGVPLGAFDDLISGQPFGSGILLWSLTMIALELLETRIPWRGFWQDWFTAGFAIVLYILAAMLISGAVLSTPLLLAAGPQIALSVLLYPVVSRMIAGLDRFRLSRSRRVG
jgi:rod shape-determining protein MreD